VTARAAPRIEISPAAVGSLALHVGVAAAFMMSWGNRDLKVGAIVPVTIVSNAPDVDTRPAEQGPETQSAMTADPVADAPPEPVPPPPLPAPPPPQAKAAKPAEKTPAPLAAKPATRPAEKAFDLDSLEASLTRPARNTPQRPSSAAKGPARPETAPVARQTVGSGLAAGAAVAGMTEELQRRWNPNCDVEGGRDVIVRVTFQLGATGQVVGEVVPQIQGARSSVATAGAERAVRAVYAAAPFRGLPREFYGDRVAVNFNAREACR
jgi:type IV secretory pathway VirB10-like protein